MVDDEQKEAKRTGTYRDQRFSSTNSRQNSLIQVANHGCSLTPETGELNSSPSAKRIKTCHRQARHLRSK